jgi:hypothetical protein
LQRTSFCTIIVLVVRYKLYWEEEIFYDLLRQYGTACLRQERVNREEEIFYDLLRRRSTACLRQERRREDCRPYKRGSQEVLASDAVSRGGRRRRRGEYFTIFTGAYNRWDILEPFQAK